MRLASIFPVVGMGVLSAGCGAGSPSPAGGLGFDLPSVPEATYLTGDSLRISVQSPLGALTIEMDSEMTLGMSFARVSDGVEVTAAVRQFGASLNNPMMGTTSVDEGDVEGPLVFVVGPDGGATVSALPTVEGGVEQLRPFLSLPHDMFPRLPGRVVDSGDSWVDTVAWSGSQDEGSFTSTTVFTYALTGDTAVGGARLMRIGVSGETTLEGSVQAQGARIQQSLTGTTSGFYLWNPEAGLVHAAELERSLEGTLSLPSMNMPSMPIRASGPFRTRIEG